MAQAESAPDQELTRQQEVAAYIENLPTEQKLKLAQELARHTTIETTFSGPLPPPDVLQQYQDTLPNAADRIFTMAEKEQQLRASGQASAFENERKRIGIVLWLGLALIAVAGLATWHGNTYIALSLGLAGTISALIRYLIRRRR